MPIALKAAIVIAVIAAICDAFFGIKDPWRKIVYIAAVVLLIVGIVQLLFPGLL